MNNENDKGVQLAFANNFQEGMQLRDYFAAHALAAMIQRNTGGAGSWPNLAYTFADAMIKERGPAC